MKAASRSVLEASKYLNLAQLHAIRDNQYRSKDCRNDYDPESVEERIRILNDRANEEAEAQALKDLDDNERLKEMLLRQVQRLRHVMPGMSSSAILTMVAGVSEEMRALGYRVPTQEIYHGGSFTVI